MSRRKMKLEFIVNYTARKATFKKRKNGFLNKVAELSTLCGIEICSVIFSPYESQPVVWPNVDGAQQVFSRFRQLPETKQTKKMVNQVEITRQRIAKAAELLRKKRVENREKKATGDVDRFLLTGTGIEGLSLPNLIDIQSILDQDLKGLKEAIEVMSPNEVCDNQQVPIPHTTVVPWTKIGNQPPPPPHGISMGYCGPRTHWLAAPPLPSLSPVPVVPKMEPPSTETYMDNGGPRPQLTYNLMTNPIDLNYSIGNGPDDMDLPFSNSTN